MKVIKEFQSKKNKVYLVKHPIYDISVKKIHTNKDFFDNEIRMLELLSRFRVPKILEYGSQTIYMEYIEGNLLLDEIVSNNLEKQEILAKGLFEFLQGILQITKGIIPADFNFRNFIIKDNCCYGVDFDRTQKGSLPDCVSKVIAFCYLYDFEIDKKRKFCMALLNHSKLCLNDIFSQIKKEVRFLELRRDLAHDNNIDAFLNSLI